MIALHLIGRPQKLFLQGMLASWLSTAADQLNRFRGARAEWHNLPGPAIPVSLNGPAAGRPWRSSLRLWSDPETEHMSITGGGAY